MVVAWAYLADGLTGAVFVLPPRLLQLSGLAARRWEVAALGLVIRIGGLLACSWMRQRAQSSRKRDHDF